jgi:hypothetical protein
MFTSGPSATDHQGLYSSSVFLIISKQQMHLTAPKDRICVAIALPPVQVFDHHRIRKRYLHSIAGCPGALLKASLL